LFIAALEVTLAIERALLTIYAICVFLQIFTVEEIRLVAEGAGNPLPREVVASWVTIEEML
jgi:hypothetical protein